MARIPNRTLVGPKFTGVDIPDGAFGQTGRAVAGLIAATGGAAETVVKHVREAQAIRNQADVRDRVREMREAQALFYQEIEENKLDPSEWLPEWKKRLATIENQLKGKNIPPVVVEAVTEQFKEFAGGSQIQISGAALKENRRRATVSWELDHRDDIQNHRWDEAEASISEVEGTLLDPVQAKAARMEIAHKRKQVERELEMRADPVEYAERLKAGEIPDLSPLGTLEEIDKANAWQARTEREAMANVQQVVDAGWIQNVEQLEAELKLYPVISSAAAAAAIREFGESNPLNFEERYKITDQISDNFHSFKRGEITLEEYVTRYNKVQTEIMIYGKRRGAGALSSLNSRYDPTYYMGPEKEGEEVAKEMAEKLETVERRAFAFIRQRATGGVQRKVAEKRAQLRDESEEGSPELAEFDAKEREFAMNFRAAMEDNVRSFLEAAANAPDGPPTFEEVEAFINKIQPEVVKEVERARKQAAANPPAMPTAGAAPRRVLPENDEQRRLRRWFEGEEATGVLPSRNFNEDDTDVLPPLYND